MNSRAITTSTDYAASEVRDEELDFARCLPLRAICKVCHAPIVSKHDGRTLVTKLSEQLILNLNYQHLQYLGAAVRSLASAVESSQQGRGARFNNE